MNRYVRKLELEYNRGNISGYERNTVIDLSVSVVRSIARKNMKPYERK